MPFAFRIRPGKLCEHSTLSHQRPGIEEIVAAVGNAAPVLDVGCGSGRLTVSLAAGGRDVTGIDVNQRQLVGAEKRARTAGVPVRWLHADMNGPLPFAEAEYGAAVSRLSLMIADDPPATLREVARTVSAGGPVVTAVWARPEENPWFTAPRSAVAEALGPERAAFARHFGRLGTTAEIEEAYKRAGLERIEVRPLSDDVHAASVAEHWDFLTQTIGHYTRLLASLTPEEADRLEDALARALEPYRSSDGLQLPRLMLLAVAQR
jgi:ubiquinone/menaquinone biosynthesis C-methylase UbiE